MEKGFDVDSPMVGGALPPMARAAFLRLENDAGLSYEAVIYSPEDALVDVLAELKYSKVEGALLRAHRAMARAATGLGSSRSRSRAATAASAPSLPRDASPEPPMDNLPPVPLFHAPARIGKGGQVRGGDKEDDKEDDEEDDKWLCEDDDESCSTVSDPTRYPRICWHQTGSGGAKRRRTAPRSAEAWNDLGFNGGDEVAVDGVKYTARQCYEKAVEVDPEYATAWNNLGYEGGGKVNGKRFSKKACYIQSLTIDPTNSSAWSSLGSTGGGTVGKTRYSEKACYQKALTLDAKDPVFWYNLGVVGGGRVGQRRYEAKQCFEQAASVDSGCILSWEKI
eukprot:Hpha_TRINITY_DN14714_c0_g2::TRINITY_DN14714_c0_g2_i3::g.102788::m.102788